MNCPIIKVRLEPQGHRLDPQGQGMEPEGQGQGLAISCYGQGHGLTLLLSTVLLICVLCSYIASVDTFAI